MATTETEREAVNRGRVAIYVLVGIVCVTTIAVVITYFNRPPQMGADEDVFKTVDALYTAVRMKDERRVTQCEKQLQSYYEAKKLPKDSLAYLDRVIARARKGQWDSATEELYEFMVAQRREGGAKTSRSDVRVRGKTGTK